MTDRGAPLLHGYGSESGSQNVACSVDAVRGGPKITVDVNPSAGVAADSGGVQTETVRIGDPSRREQNRVRVKRLPCR
jgi:hypothetical protein